MKIGFLVPIQGINQYGDVYLSIVGFLQKKGHEVIHPLSHNEPLHNLLAPTELDKVFEDYFTSIKKCDLIIAECSYPCVSIGYEMSNIIQQGKEVIVLKVKDNQALPNFNPLYTKKNIYLYEYYPHDLLATVAEAIAYNPSQKYKKYNILFTPEMVAKLNQIAKKKNLHKSVYIRQLLERGLATEE